MKRFWLPTQKGTELFPSTTRVPTQLIVRGVEPGAPLYEAVAEEYGGRVRQFHAKAQQAHALSVNQISRFRANFGDEAHATYTNIQGNETIELDVRRDTLERLHKQFAEYWDFALIELYVPNALHAYSDTTFGPFAIAHLTSPIEAQLTDSSALPADGVATNFLSKDKADKIINCAEEKVFQLGAPVRTTIDDSGDAYASFIVDLRPARGLSAVTVDLYAWFDKNEEFPRPIYLEGFGPDVNATQAHISANYADARADGPTAGRTLWPMRGLIEASGQFQGFNLIVPSFRYPDPDNTNQTVIVQKLPDIYFDTSDALWKFTATSDQFFDQKIAETEISPTFHPLPFPGYFTYDTVTGPFYAHWCIATSGTYRPYLGPGAALGDVRLALFKGSPTFEADQFISTGGMFSYDRWTIDGKVVGEMTMARDIAIEVGPVTGDRLGQIQAPKLGTATIMLDTRYGVSWQNT